MQVSIQEIPDRVIYAQCPLCDSENIQNLLTADCSKHKMYDSQINPKINWKHCVDCTHIFTSGYFTDESCEIIFRKTLDNQVVGRHLEESRIISAKMIEKVLPYVNSGCWLDVGFGNGSLLFTAQEYGFIPLGIDLRKSNVDLLNSFGIQSYCVNLEKLEVKNKLSVISMADVIEHMPYPKKGLCSANKLLSDNGVLLISMPNTENIVWKMLSEHKTNPYWGELEHYHNFSRMRLYKLLEEFGFLPIRYGISERYRICMEVVAIKKRDVA